MTNPFLFYCNGILEKVYKNARKVRLDELYEHFFKIVVQLHLDILH